ncbi:MAG: protein kinase, partial [Ilumatobacter sp.]|uniref:serine/threonine-protein kinase n=1 Tax=Ilumatobacter sp. TaxID=1967498 RepID=UPI003C712927
MNPRYEVLDVLGSGGMATVWRARDTDLNRLVAIKRPHPAPTESAVYERFRREARAAATVSHPNVVTVHDVGTDDDGPYLVMELVDAGSLAEVEWSRAKAIGVGVDIAEALSALHLAGIVHRDVKPANILVPDGGALLTDFGIARAGDDDALTQEGMTFATPGYAAPEVIARGEHTTASDVYSLAAVLREMILGRRVAPTTDTQVMIADDLWAPVIERAMSARPEDRPTASAFAAELRALPPAAGLAPTTSLGVATAATPASRSDAALASSDGTVPNAVAAGPARPWLPALSVALVALVIFAVLVVAVRRPSDDGAATLPSSDASV